MFARAIAIASWVIFGVSLVFTGSFAFEPLWFFGWAFLALGIASLLVLKGGMGWVLLLSCVGGAASIAAYVAMIGIGRWAASGLPFFAAAPAIAVATSTVALYRLGKAA